MPLLVVHPNRRPGLKTDGAELVRLGDEFARRGENCLLLVPSVFAPNENNWLINPAPADYKSIVVRATEPLSYDPRMFRKQRRHRRH